MAAMEAVAPPRRHHQLVVEPVDNARLGAIVTGLDLTDLSTVDGSTREELNSALYAHGVIVLRGSGALTPEQQWGVYQLFDHLDYDSPYTGEARDGEYSIPDYTAQGGDWSLLPGSGGHVEVLGTVEGARHNPLYAGFAWHSDGMYFDQPPTLTSMYAIETPANGAGNTNFLSGAAA